MSKIKLEFKLPEKKEIEHNGKIIEVTPFLTLAQQVFLINEYTKEYFYPPSDKFVDVSEYNYLGAEYALMNYIFQVATNLDTDNLDSNLYSDFILWQKITGEIINYIDFRNKLYYVIMEVKEQKSLNNSIGKVLSDLLGKAYELLDKVKDITPEQIETARKAGLELAEKLEKSSIIATPVETKQKKIKK